MCGDPEIKNTIHSFTCTVARVMERIIFDRIVDTIDSKLFISVWFS